MRSLRDVAPGILSSLFQRGTLTQAKLEAAWRIAVGSALSKASAVRLGDAGTIEASAADHHWRRELERSSAVIRERLNGMLGEGTVTRLVLADGSAPRHRRLSRGRQGEAES